MKDKIEDILLAITAIIILLVCLIGLPALCILAVIDIYKQYNWSIDHPLYYEYIDLDNNVGTTYRGCNYDSLGGQGAMVCRLDDGTVIQVKQYKQLREGVE